jgi:2-polyprenyl-6-hydroxyphenyl methylase/3-demethylubiquinone-9 3-methyltransferase
MIIISTLLQPDNIDQQGVNWWYAGPRNGHVSLFSRASLEKIVKPLGFNLDSFNADLHVLYRKIPEFAKPFFKWK